MKIKLPDPSEFSFEMLAERWRCTTDLILRYVNDGILEMKTSYPAIFEYDPNTGKDEFIGNTVKQYFTRKEVLRFEADHPPTTAPPVPATTAPSTIPAATESYTIMTTTEKTQRKDALAKILIEITNDFKAQHKRTPTSNEVMNKVKALCRGRKHTVIQEVIENKIYWKSAKGIDKITSYHQLQNRLTGINAV